MLVRRLIESLRELRTRSEPPRTVSEERIFSEDVERLDREEPDWDRDARLARCEAALKRGLSRELLAGIYGEEMVREAEAKQKTGS